MTIPNRVVDAIYEAVKAAISSGTDVDDFIASARESWIVALDEEKAGAMRLFDKAMKKPWL